MGFGHGHPLHAGDTRMGAWFAFMGAFYNFYPSKLNKIPADGICK